MKDSPHVLRARLRWVQLYQETGNASLVCRRCGISRPTLRKWWTRYQAEGEAGLHSRSHRPHTIKRKVTDEHVEWIRHLRIDRKLGPKRIQAELVRLHGFHLAASTIWTVLRRNGWRYLRRPKVPLRPKRYAKDVPGDRVQMDTVKVGKGLFQYTATDDCTRMRVLALYPKRNAATSVRFLRDHVLGGESPDPRPRRRQGNLAAVVIAPGDIPLTNHAPEGNGLPNLYRRRPPAIRLLQPESQTTTYYRTGPVRPSDGPRPLSGLALERTVHPRPERVDTSRLHRGRRRGAKRGTPGSPLHRPSA